MAAITRQVASEQLSAASELYAAGKSSEAAALMQRLVSYGGFVGRMLELSGWDGDAAAGDLAEQYLGALTLTPELDNSVDSKLTELSKAGLASGDEALLDAMLALSAPGLDAAKATFRQVGPPLHDR